VHPVFTFGPVELSSYALLIALGGSLGFWLTFREIERARLPAGPLLGLAVVCFVAGLLGARALSVLLHQRWYAGRPWWALLAVWDPGGMALYGGLALAGIAGLAYARARRLPVWETADRLALAWVPFLAVVRIGCFLNGCCYGRPTTSALGLVAGGSPNAVNFGIPSHPTQLYEAAALAGIAGLCWWLRGRRRFAGQLTLVFLALHSAVRFALEPLRGDPRGPTGSVGPLGTVTFNQVVALALLAFAVLAFAPLYAGGADDPARRRSRKASTPASASGSE
jgi:phosphatidylglycerol---prolipoprotein diacylglyceryl transferase